MDDSAVMAFEVGKNRIEALGEVEESADLHPLLRPDGRGQRRSTTTRWATSATPTVHTRSILRPHGVFAVVSPFNFPMALATGPTERRDAGRQHGRAQAVERVAAVGGQARRGVHRCRRPEGCRQPRHGSGRDRRPGAPGPPRHRRHRVHRLVRGRDEALPLVQPDVAAPVHRRDGRQEPGDRVAQRPTSRRRPRGSCAAAFGFGGQKCSANSRVYVERPVHDELVRLLVEKTEAITIGDPLVRANWLGPIIDQRAVDRHQTAVAEARRDGTVFIGGERLTDGDLARGFYVEPTVVGGLPAVAPPVPRRAVRAVHRGRTRSTRSTRRSTLANDTVYGPDGRRLQRGPGRGRAVPRPHRGGRPVRQPARRRDDRARGRASRRSAAGRGVARPARPACRCTTWRSSCASSPTPSSTGA